MSERKMWEQKEDNMIMLIVKENQKRSEENRWKWSQIAEILQKKIPGCTRTGKQCRERWYNHLNPQIIKDKDLTEQQISKLFDLQNQMGNKWALIAKYFPGRTDNNLKNFFYSSLRRAIRQINQFVSQYKKKSNIKPFKHNILTKILNISDERHKQKLDIKSDRAQDIAKNLKQMLANLSFEPEQKQLDSYDIEFREKVVRTIQQFNKNCKKRKSKKIEESEEPDLDQIIQAYQPSVPSLKQTKSRKKKTENIVQDQQKPALKEQSKTPTQKQLKTVPLVIQYQNLFTSFNQQGKKNGKDIQENAKEGLQSKEKQNVKQQNKNIPNLFGDFMRQSNGSYNQHFVPKLLTRKSSHENKMGFLHTLQNWKKHESRCENSLFPSDNPLEPMLESINIGENIGKITEGSMGESVFYKFIKGESKIQPNN